MRPVPDSARTDASEHNPGPPKVTPPLVTDLSLEEL
jgi:hypothetical protein